MTCHIFDNNIQEKKNNSKGINIFINQWGVSTHYSFFIPYEINKNKFKLRKEYIKYINKLGVSKILGKKIRDFFTIDNVSYFTLSKVNEKNIFHQDSKILKSIKFLSIKKILDKKKIKKIIYNCLDKDLEKVLALYCSQKNIFFISKAKNSSISFTYKLKKTILFFLYFFQIKFYIKKNFATNNPSIFFFSYFLKFKKTKKKYPNQDYWGNLFEITKKNKIKIQINYIFDKNKEYNLKEAEEFLIDKNSKLINNAILNDAISIQSFFCLIFYYSILFLKSFFISKKNFQQNNVNLYYFLKDDLYSSLRGTFCIKNLFFNFCIKEFFTNKKKIKIGFYLFENLFWEKLINYYWKKYKHGKLIAVMHNSIGFWDFRYHLNDHKKYLPNLIFSNSKYNKKIFMDINFNKQITKIIQVNTLNYANNIKKKKYTDKKYKILIIGDIKIKNTEKLLDIACSVARDNRKYKLFFKPHPSNLVNLKKLKDRSVKLVSELNFEKYDIAITTTTSSAYIEALVANKKTFIYRDAENFNSLAISHFRNLNYFNDKNSLRQSLLKKSKYINFNYYNNSYKFLQWNQILLRIKKNNFDFIKMS